MPPSNYSTRWYVSGYLNTAIAVQHEIYPDKTLSPMLTLLRTVKPSLAQLV